MCCYSNLLLITILLLVSCCCHVDGTFLKSRQLKECDTFTGCFLVNLKTKAELLLSNTTKNVYTLDASNDWGYSIRCDVSRGHGESNYITFMYDRRSFTEWGYPRYMNGNAHEGKYVLPVPFLSQCGPKQLTVEGHIWTAFCFTNTYSIEAINEMNAPCDPNALAVPIRAPTLLPTSAPATKAPIKSPIKPPTSVPMKPLTTAPIMPPSTTTVKPPAKAPISPPISIPMKAPTTAAINAPIMIPAKSPVIVPMKLPVFKPITTPVKVKISVQVPVVAPVYVNVPVPTPIRVSYPLPDQVTVPGKTKGTKQKKGKATAVVVKNGLFVSPPNGGKSVKNIKQ